MMNTIHCKHFFKQFFKHFLTQCKNNEKLINTMKTIAMNSNAEFDLKWMLSNEDIFGIIYDFTCEMGIKI